MFRCSRARTNAGAPSDAFSHLLPWSSKFHLLIYPAGMFWRRFGIFAFVGEKVFRAKFILYGEGGVEARF